MKRINNLTDSEFISILKESTSIAEVLFKLGYSVAGNTCGYNIIKQRMLDLDIDGSIFKGKSIIKTNKISILIMTYLQKTVKYLGMY